MSSTTEKSRGASARDLGPVHVHYTPIPRNSIVESPYEPGSEEDQLEIRSMQLSVVALGRIHANLIDGEGFAG
jgi:hypothetical protein